MNENRAVPADVVTDEWMRDLAEALDVPVELLDLPAGVGHWSTRAKAQENALRAFFAAAYPDVQFDCSPLLALPAGGTT